MTGHIPQPFNPGMIGRRIKALEDRLLVIARNRTVWDALRGKASTVHDHDAADVTSGTLSIDRMPAVVPWATAAGTVTITVSAASSGSTVVTLPAGRFTATPIIHPSKDAGLPKWIPYVTAESATSFTIGAESGDGTTATGTLSLRWAAVQMTSTSGAG